MEFTLKAHTFDTIELANAAIDVINQGEGIPVDPNSVTRTYTEPQENNGTIYIVSDEVTQKYLGEPIQIKILYTES